MIFRILKSAVALMACCSLMVGCDGGGGGDDDDGGGDGISGTWKGVGHASVGVTAPTTLVLSQDGNKLSGKWDGYAVGGTFDGKTVVLGGTWRQYNLTYTINMRGTYDGKNIVNMSGKMAASNGRSSSITIPVLTRSGNLADDESGILESLSDSLK
jgi:hypothetical protein